MHQLNAADAEEIYSKATQHYQAGRLQDALNALSPIAPMRSSDHRFPALAGFALIRKEDPGSAVPFLKRACELSPKTPLYHQALGDAYLSLKDAPNAERAYAEALRIDRDIVTALVGLCNALAYQDRHKEALALLRARIKRGDRNLLLLSTCASFQSALNDKAEALETSKLAVAAHPTSATANHNLAARFGDLLLHEEAISYALKAMELGQNGPLTWLVMARGLQGMGRLEQADEAFSEILRAAPSFAEAHRDYAQLQWMRTGDVNVASRKLRASLSTRTGDPSLSLALAKVLEFGGDLSGARSVIGDARRATSSPSVDLLAAEVDYALADDDTALAQSTVQELLSLEPNLPRALYVSCDVLLATGKEQQALETAQALLHRDPLDIHARARYATALRLVGDPNYQVVYNYKNLVREYCLEPPKGWSSLESFISDLKSVLLERHCFKQHPFDQSLRNGRQTPLNFETDKHPVIQALGQAFQEPIRDHLNHVLKVEKIRQASPANSFKITGAWSVRLHSEGYHANHIHQHGWVSSALYIDLPSEEGLQERHGWLKFGEPGLKTIPTLDAEHWIKPKVGHLALFPSYMWHGTEPFISDAGRMTVAMDVTPT